MLDFSTCSLDKVVAHYVGNKVRNEGVLLSKGTLHIAKEDTKSLFLKYILSSFSGNQFYRLYHDSELTLNEIYNYCCRVFANPKEFEKQSRNIAQHLYNESLHPKIMQGEVYIVYLGNCVVDDEIVEGIGIFKSETKDAYLKPVKIQDEFALKSEQGVNVAKLDKGCIIFNTHADDGYKVSIIDNVNKGEEAQYWKEKFLKLKPLDDGYNNTKQFLDIAKVFVSKQISEEFEIEKTEQINMLKRSVDYFKTHDTFNKKEFEKEVFQDTEIIKSFKKFDEGYRQTRDLDISDDFEISAVAVKKQARAFKSVLKLDKNFHIYIHGDSNLIEQGVERDGRKYYKIYFQQEA